MGKIFEAAYEGRHGKARQWFESFAGMDVGQLPSDPVDAMQVRLLRWQTANFGLPSDLAIAAGVAEEVGELAEAAEIADVAAVEDGFGDVMIYAGQILGSNRMALRSMLDAPGIHSGREAIHVGRFEQAVLKRDQRIRGFADDEFYRRELWARLYHVVRSCLTTTSQVRSPRTPSTIGLAAEIYLAVGERVLARDWRANPSTGVGG